MYSLLICLSIYISYIDLKTHKIRNRTLVLGLFIFSSLSVIEGGTFYPGCAIIAFVVSPLFLKLGVGAGDIKLFALLSTFFLPSSLYVALDFIYVFLAIAALLTLITTVRERSFQSNIALAPAICGAFIWCTS